MAIETRTVAIIQARMGSTRLPGKVLKPILGQPMLWHIVQRVRWVPDLVEVVVATSNGPGDEPIRRFCREHGIALFAGSENDVLDRFYQAACWSSIELAATTTSAWARAQGPPWQARGASPMAWTPSAFPFPRWHEPGERLPSQAIGST